MSKTIIATLRSILLKLDRIKGVSEHVKRSLRVLKSFVGAVKIKVEDIEFFLDIDGEPGVADSGTLARDFAEVFVAAGEAAKARKSSIIILIDEIQNLPAEEFEALIMVVHRTDQKRLPHGSFSTAIHWKNKLMFVVFGKSSELIKTVHRLNVEYKKARRSVEIVQ